MQIGFNAPTSGVLIEPDSLTRVVTEGEALGFDYATISDHIMVPRHLDSKYPYTNTGEFPAGTQAAWLENVNAVLPSAAGAQLHTYAATATATIGPGGRAAAPTADVVLNGWGGLGVVVAWILVALIPALVLIRRRDA